MPEVTLVIKKCIERHPVLSTVVQDGETERPQLARVPKMDLADHMVVLPAYDEEDYQAKILQTILERRHNEPFVKGNLRPQWRVYVGVLRSASASSARSHVAFACSHALADGISGRIFHKTFLQALQHVASPKTHPETILEPPTANQLPLPLDRSATLPISWSFLLRPLLGEYLPPALAKLLGFSSENTEDMWCGASKRPDIGSSASLLTTAAHVILVSNPVLQRVVETCRTHQARITGLLNHLIASALGRALRARGHQYTRFIAQTPIDLRRAAAIDKDCMGNYTSAYTETIEVNPGQIEGSVGMTSEDWDAVRCSTKCLSDASSTLADQPVALLRYLNDFRGWTLKNARKPANKSFSVSNLGVFAKTTESDVTGKQDWSIEAMAFSQPADATGAPLNVNVASAEKGALVMSVTWWPGMLGVEKERAFVEEVFAVVVRQLEAISRG